MRAIKQAPLLVVEDNADDLFLFTRLLKKAQVNNPLYLSSDGEEAVGLLRRVVQGDDMIARPIAAFVDIKMPRMDGFDLLGWVRAQPELDTMPVIVLSSSSEARDVARAAKLGAQYFFSKYPSDETIRRVMEAAARFASSGVQRRVHNVPCNLLPETDGPVR
jgi:CheY-like chemotaxis protein